MKLLLIMLLISTFLITDVARAQTIVPLAPSTTISVNDANPFRLYGVPSDALIMNAGVFQGPRDIQMGWWHPAVPSLVNGDIGAGSTAHPGVLNIGADVTRTVRLQSMGKTVLRTRRSGVTVQGTLTVCAQKCVNLQREIRMLKRQVRGLLRRLK